MIKIKGTPYSYQREAIDFHKSKSRSLSLLDMGLGKSLVAIHSMEGINKVLIICPAFLVPNWLNETKKWSETSECFSIISYESLHKLDVAKYEGIILDEIHYIKNHKAKRTQKVSHLVSILSPKKVIGLTGTPIKNHVPDFWSILRLILQDKMKLNFWQFCNYFSNRYETNFGVIFKGLNSKNALELSKLVESCSIRKKTKDVIDLPEQNFNFINVSDREFEDKVKEEYTNYLEHNLMNPNFMSFKLANAVTKTEFTIKLAQEILDQDNQVVIFSDHVESCRVIAQVLGVTPITGSTNNRQELIDDFNLGKTKVIVATIKSLNVGVNLTSARYMVFNDFSYSYADNEQAEKRIHRIGQKFPCFYTYIFASKLDQHIFSIVQGKKQVNKQLNF